MHPILAIRVFFATLFSGATAVRVRKLLSADGVEPQPQLAAPPKPTSETKPKEPARSEALTLLATLQREARFIDFIQESLADYDDAQIGAAARDVHRDCAATLRRIFELKPAVSEEEGTVVELASGFDAARYRLTGAVAGQPPFRGKIVHPGWEATKCELPVWTGGKESKRIVAPAEVEI